MRLNLYSALTILGIVLLAASVLAMLFIIAVADQLEGPEALFLFSVIASAFFGSMIMIQSAFRKGEPIITHILDVLEREENE